MSKNIVRNVLVLVIALFITSGSVIAYTYKSSKNPFASFFANKYTVSANTSDITSVGVKPTAVETVATSESSSSVNVSSSTSQSTNISTQKLKVKALYLTGWTAGNMENIKHYIDLANTTEINSYVLDIKDDDGLVGYESNIPAVKEIKAWTKKYDVDKVIKAFHENNIHVIGRIVCFKDPYLSSKKPDLAVKNINGGLFRSRSTDGQMVTWLNPSNKDSWPYLIDIAKEAVSKGFDEIQFDYVRFPNDGDRKAMDFGNMTEKRYEVIDEFLAYARKEMPNTVLSGDVFGIICESPADTENIGQNLEYVGKDINYISPMAYPSHYAPGQIVNKVKFDKPDLDPYGVVYNTLLKAKDRISKVDGYNASIRAYLQDFTAS